MTNPGNDLPKMAITAFNVLVLLALPCATFWHSTMIKSFKTWSDRWWMQIITVVVYLFAINAEIPAFWSRILAYYTHKLAMPDVFYTLTAWDRWGHLLFYAAFIMFTWMQTRRQIPDFVKHTLS